MGKMPSIAAKEQFDLLLFDVQMPVVDGVTALKIIRERHLADGVPAVVLTAYALSGDREKYLRGPGFRWS